MKFLFIILLVMGLTNCNSQEQSRDVYQPPDVWEYWEKKDPIDGTVSAGAIWKETGPHLMSHTRVFGYQCENNEIQSLQINGNLYSSGSLHDVLSREGNTNGNSYSSGSTHDVVFRVDNNEPLTLTFVVAGNQNSKILGATLAFVAEDKNLPQLDRLLSQIESAKTRLVIRVGTSRVDTNTLVLPAYGGNTKITRAAFYCR